MMMLIYGNPHPAYLLLFITVQLDLAKGLEFLESGFEAQGEVTPRNAYMYLSVAYERAGKPVPFKIPFDKQDFTQPKVGYNFPYRKVPKFSDARKPCYNQPKI